ncbi:MAG TPA: DUF1565 domain-containing protein, partial [Allocoleopsis sp.]
MNYTKWTKITKPLGLSLLTGILIIAGNSVNMAQSVEKKSSNIIAQVPANSNVIYVNQSLGKDTTGGGSQNAPYSTINYALQQAQSGTIISIAPGTYSEESGETFPLIVKPGVTLRGDDVNNGQNIIIKGGGGFISPSLAGQNITIRALQDSQIIGLTITNPNKRGTGVWVESTNPVIINNTFTNNKREGVLVTGNGNPKIQNNIFIQNSGNGLSLAKNAKGEVRENLFDNTGTGISIGDAVSSIIINNRVQKNRDGVVISGSATPTINSNIIENNNDNGLVMIGSAKPNVGTAENPGKNKIRNNGKFDIYNTNTTNLQSLIGNEVDYDKVSEGIDLGFTRPPKPTTKPTTKPTPVKKPTT